MKVRVLLLLCVCLILGGCGSTGAADFALSKLSTEDGYAYPGLSWGMSIEETENALDTQLEDAMRQVQSDFAEQENIILYPANEDQKYLELCGATGYIGYQFLYGELTCVTVGFKEKYGNLPENDLEKLKEELPVALEKALGEKPTFDSAVASGENIPVSHDLYEWKKEGASGSTTFVRVATFASKGKSTLQSMTLDVSTFTPPEE